MLVNTVIVNGKEESFSKVLNLMDDSLLEQIYNKIGISGTKQELVNMYCALHEQTFGKPFKVWGNNE